MEASTLRENPRRTQITSNQFSVNPFPMRLNPWKPLKVHQACGYGFFKTAPKRTSIERRAQTPVSQVMEVCFILVLGHRYEACTLVFYNGVFLKNSAAMPRYSIQKMVSMHVRLNSLGVAPRIYSFEMGGTAADLNSHGDAVYISGMHIMLDLHTCVGIERFCSCCFVCQHNVCMTLHLSADYMYSLGAVAFVKNLSIPTRPVFLGFRNVATTASLFNVVTVSMSWLCRLISCNIMVFVFLRLHRWKVCTQIYIYILILTLKIHTTAY